MHTKSMRPQIIAICFALGFGATTAHAGYLKKIELTLRARALEAKERIQQPSSRSDSEATPTEKCALFLEKGFYLFSDKSSGVFFRSGKKDIGALLIIDSGSSRAVIAFEFKDKYPLPVQVSTIQVDEGWSMSVAPGMPQGSFMIQSKSCTYKFSAQDYLHPEVESY